MKPEWILIANASRAGLLQREPGCPQVVIHSFEHALSGSLSSELGDAPAGQEKADRSFGGAAYQPRMDPKEKEHLRFAHEMSQYLERQAQQGNFKSLALYASSPFLGELKAALGTAAAGLVSATHDLDLPSVGLVELDQRIAHQSTPH